MSNPKKEPRRKIDVDTSETVEEHARAAVDQEGGNQDIVHENGNNGVVNGDDVSDKRDKTRTTATKVVERTNKAAALAVDAVAEWNEQIHVRRRLTWPTRVQLLDWAPFIAVVLLAAILRFWGLGDRPLHHDESLHAYFSLQLLHNTIENWLSCARGLPSYACYSYNPLLHGPFQFHMIAFVYLISQWLGAPDHGVNTTTVRIGAAMLGTVLVALPYFLRGYIGKLGSWLACVLLAVSPSMVYFSRFAREDIYMACFTLLMVVAVGCYVRTRRAFWLIVAALGFGLSYATNEATFLTIAVFGSFLALLLAWELGVRLPVRSRANANVALAARLPRTAAPIFLSISIVIVAAFAKIFLSWMENLSTYVNNHPNPSNLFVQNLESGTVKAFPWLGILLGVIVTLILLRELFGKLPPSGRRGLAKHIDPEKQPLLDTIITMPWTHWFFALMTAVAVFLVLFTALFTDISQGIGTGIWQGLYYWLQQQQIARGGQPWYYYLMLIPLYEQIGVIFGVAGIIRCLLRPSPLRLFLVYWFVGNLFIYSWAGEKMPWLMIHITMPMLILAAIGLEPIVVRLVSFARAWRVRTSVAEQTAAEVQRNGSRRWQPRAGWVADAGALFGGMMAVLLLVLTLQNMFQVTYVHAADAPHEMMIYVQTTPDVDIVMNKISELDQQKFGGKHQIPIGVMAGAEWPFYWYLRDYTGVCYDYPSGCGSMNPAVIISAVDSLYTSQTQYASTVNGKPGAYLFHQYHLRTWWDEGYKPVPCVPSGTNTCAGQSTAGGVGLWLWLSYGDNPPPGATFNLARAVSNVWQWWWQRKAIGGTAGSTDMGLLIRRDLGVQP